MKYKTNKTNNISIMKSTIIIFLLLALISCNTKPKQTQSQEPDIKSQSKEYFEFTKTKALEIVKTGFNAGDGYGEVWIRDYNTFIELSAEVFEAETLKENLLVFFKMQETMGILLMVLFQKTKLELDTIMFIPTWNLATPAIKTQLKPIRNHRLFMLFTNTFRQLATKQF